MSVEMRYARNGKPVPTLILTNRIPIPLHSTYDPEKEAQKIFSDIRKTDLLLIIGGGWGYLPSLADDGKRTVVVIIFPEETTFYRNNPPPFLKKKTIRTIEAVGNWPQTLASILAPFCFHSLRLIINNGWEKADPVQTFRIKTEAESVIDNLINDAAVFKRFGRLWHTHFMKNIALPKRILPSFRPVETVGIIGASPNWQRDFDKIRRQPEKKILIAVDTVYPALIACGIVPDYVVSIDAQLLTLNHFTGPVSPETTLVADLTALPALCGRFQKILWCAGAHPLCRLAARYFNLPPLNTEGGNVSVSALSFARLFHPRKILTAGIDFSYPNGNTYGRGTWLPLRWLNTGFRLSPQDTKNEEMLQSRPYHYDSIKKCYEPALFSRYREAWNREWQSPLPELTLKKENPDLFFREIRHLPEVCTAPLRCWEFYRNNTAPSDRNDE